MALHNEIEFERGICHRLAAHGWLYAEGDAYDYDDLVTAAQPAFDPLPARRIVLISAVVTVQIDAR